MLDIQLLTTPLQTQDCIDFVSSDSAGGMTVFIGTVRNQTQGKPVLRLEFEAYAPMAISEMRKIATQAVDRWGVSKMAIHRKAAFEACEFAIDTLKETVPIWKKEFFEDGAVWVAAHP
jgi:molybdopterin synthase catalytic subunit